jgi:hypothetical protein
MSTPLKNWGRWGQDDQKGTLNLITPDKIKIATQLVKAGQVYSLSMPLEAEDRNFPAAIKPGRPPASSMLRMAPGFLMML